MALKSVLRRMSRAFTAKDERAFDEAMEELEEKLESNDETPEEAIEIHNHIPGQDTLGEMPPKDPANDRRARDEGEEAPPWFKKHEEATDAKFKSMQDSLDKMRDRRGRDEFPPNEEEEEEGLIDDDPDNLDMDRRRSNDEPAEREEMAERIKENSKDEANKAILGELEFEAPPGTGDRAMRAKDSRFLEESFQDTVAKAEVLFPGIHLPTFDKAAPPIKTAKVIHGLRRKALDAAYSDGKTRGIIDQCMSGRTMDSKRMAFSATRVLFNAVAGAVAQRNNSRATDRGADFGARSDTRQAPRLQTIADINNANREKFSRVK